MEKMINQEELIVCKRRGHSTGISLRDGWVQCKWCGIWLREVTKVEEREDTPPEGEQNQLVVLKKKVDEIKP